MFPARVLWRKYKFIGCDKSSSVVPVNKRFRHRQHVNPLSSRFQSAVTIPTAQDWRSFFQDAYQPLVLDMGCNRGLAVRKLAQEIPHVNFVGLEINPNFLNMARERLQCMSTCTSGVSSKDLPNVHYNDSDGENISPTSCCSWQRKRFGNAHIAYGNANVHLNGFFRAYPGKVIAAMAMFPDPYTQKRRIFKRRMLTADLFQLLHKKVGVEAILVRTDVQDVMDYVQLAAIASGLRCSTAENAMDICRSELTTSVIQAINNVETERQKAVQASGGTFQTRVFMP